MGDGLFGSPATTTTSYPPPIMPAGYNFANSFYNTLAPMLMGGNLPTYPYNVDPGLSPSMQTAIRMSQGYAQSPSPYAMGQAGGTLGAFMNPQMASVGWGMSQPYPSFLGMPPMPQGYPQGAGALNPWANLSQTYGGGSGTSGLGNPYASLGP